MASLGHLYPTAGALTRLEAQRKQRYVAPFEMALIHEAMHDNAKALADLEQGYVERSLSAQSLLYDPRLADLRKEPQYLAFVKRIGL